MMLREHVSRSHSRVSSRTRTPQKCSSLLQLPLPPLPWYRHAGTVLCHPNGELALLLSFNSVPGRAPSSLGSLRTSHSPAGGTP